jgi:hypothetical protein
MSRSVITYEHPLGGAADLAPKSGEAPLPPEDKYKDRLLKYIPGEVVTLYVTLMSLLATASGVPGWLDWAVFGVGLIATPYYLNRNLDVKDRTQLTISTVAFVVWAFALGGPFKMHFDWYHPIYGGLLLPAYTFFAGLVKTAPQKPL